MADADPPDEVDDVHAPPDGHVGTPDADAREDEVGDRHEHAHQQEEADGEADVPEARRRLGEHDRADLVGDRREVVLAADEWDVAQRTMLGRAHDCPPFGRSGPRSLAVGLRTCAR
jgi:hypothetical protein